MIDYYYEFEKGSKLFGESIRYAFQRGYHPEDCTNLEKELHNTCFINATRIWLENANGLTLVRQYGRDVHIKCNPKIITWLKLQSKEL